MVRPVSLRAAGCMSILKMSAVGEKKTVAPVFDEICEMTGVTLSRYMMEVARQNPDLRDLESLMGGIQQACKTIANLVDRATITGMVHFPRVCRLFTSCVTFHHPRSFCNDERAF